VLVAGSQAITLLLMAKLMFDWLNDTERATRLESAIARVIAEGKVRTYDVGGNASTLDVVKAVAEYAG
jgi:3-isopropylmalate dehydrogenase